jgi:GNAT superfamily N-acetyltransferase
MVPSPQPASADPTFTVTAASQGDLAMISGLARDIWQRHYPGIISREQIDFMLDIRYSPERLRHEAGKPGQRFLVARLAGEPVGFASLSPAEDAPDEMVLRAFYLHPDHHGHGFGRRFMEQLVDEVRGSGYRLITLNVHRRNIKAINFYFKAGFVIRSSVDVPIGRGFELNDFIMARALG